MKSINEINESKKIVENIDDFKEIIDDIKTSLSEATHNIVNLYDYVDEPIAKLLDRYTDSINKLSKSISKVKYTKQ